MTDLDINVGDKIRVIQEWHSGCIGQFDGKIGTVVSVNPADLENYPVCVVFPAADYGDGVTPIPIYIHKCEPVKDDQVSETKEVLVEVFKVGDRVKYVDGGFGPVKRMLGKTGTVAETDEVHPRLRITWDEDPGDLMQWFNTHNFVLIENKENENVSEFEVGQKVRYILGTEFADPWMEGWTGTVTEVHSIGCEVAWDVEDAGWRNNTNIRWDARNLEKVAEIKEDASPEVASLMAEVERLKTATKGWQANFRDLRTEIAGKLWEKLGPDGEDMDVDVINDLLEALDLSEFTRKPFELNVTLRLTSELAPDLDMNAYTPAEVGEVIYSLGLVDLIRAITDTEVVE